MKDRSSTVFFFLPNWYNAVVVSVDGIVVAVIFAVVVGREVVKASVPPRMNRTASAKRTRELLWRYIMVDGRAEPVRHTYRRDDSMNSYSRMRSPYRLTK